MRLQHIGVSSSSDEKAATEPAQAEQPSAAVLYAVLVNSGEWEQHQLRLLSAFPLEGEPHSCAPSPAPKQACLELSLSSSSSEAPSSPPPTPFSAEPEQASLVPPAQGPPSDCPSSPPPFPPSAPPRDGSGVETPSPLRASWYLAHPSWDICLQRSQYTAVFVHPQFSGQQDPCPVPDIEFQLVEDPVKGPCFYF